MTFIENENIITTPSFGSENQWGSETEAYNEFFAWVRKEKKTNLNPFTESYTPELPLGKIVEPLPLGCFTIAQKNSIIFVPPPPNWIFLYQMYYNLCSQLIANGCMQPTHSLFLRPF